MGTRDLDNDESHCVATCAQKHVNTGRKTLELFSAINPAFQEKKLVEQQEQLKKIENEKVAAAAAAAAEAEKSAVADIENNGKSKLP